MRNWLAAAVLGATLGCQAGALESQAIEETTEGADRALAAKPELARDQCYGEGNFCDTQLPPAQPWIEGNALPQTPKTAVVLLTRASKSVWRAYAADGDSSIVYWVRTMKPAAVGSFTSAVVDIDLSLVAIRPPPPLDCPPICIEPAGYWNAAALRALHIEEDALADVAACPRK